MKTFRFYGWGGSNAIGSGETVADALKASGIHGLVRYEEVDKEPSLTDEFDFLLHIAKRFARSLSNQDYREVCRIQEKYARDSKRTVLVELGGGSMYCADIWFEP